MSTGNAMRTGWQRATAAVYVTAAGVALTLGACGSSAVPSDRGGPVVSAKTRSETTAPQHEVYAKLGYRLNWRGFPDVSEGHRIVGVEPLGDTVLVRESATRVSAIDTKSGSLRWSDQIAGPLTNLVGAVRWDNTIAILSDTDAILMDAGTGNLLNRYPLGKVTSVPPIVAGPALVVASSDGGIMAFERRTGFRLWANSVESTVEVPGTPVMGTAAAFVSRNGDLLVADLGSGSGQGRARMRGAPTAAPTASNDTVFVASVDQSVYAFEARTGDQLWRHRTATPLLGAPVYHDGAVFVDVPGSGFTALDSASGRPVWTREGVKGTLLAVLKGRLIVWDASSGTATVLDRTDGSVIDRASFEGVVSLTADGLVDPVLYVATTAGVLERLTPR
jgi:outer membrane protein assembly factor BamB